MVFFDFDKRLHRLIRLDDERLELPATIAYGRLSADKKHAQDNNLPTIAELDRKLRSVRRYPGRMKELAEDLLRDCGIDVNKQFDMDDLATIGNHLQTYHIRLYKRQPPTKFYSIEWEANQDSDQLINLAVFANRYDTFSPSRKSIGKYVCSLCYKMYTRLDYHRCSKKCGTCRQAICEGERVPDFECDDCHYIFYKMECFVRHRQKGPRGGSSPCDMFKRCPLCLTCYKPSNFRQGQTHVCGNTRWCPECRDHVNPDGHNCCWIPPSDRTIQILKEKQSEFKIVVYDCETVLLRESDRLNSYGQQWANMVCYAIFCHQCMDIPLNQPCGNCRVPRTGHFKHRTGQAYDIAAKKIVYYLLSQPSLNGALVFAHNAARFDLHFLIHPLLELGIKPDVILKGLTIMQLTIKAGKGDLFNSLTFKDSYLLIPMALSNLPSSYGFQDDKKGTFPYLYNHPDRYSTVLPTLPSIEHYNPGNMKPAARKAFETWYEENRETPFDFDHELLNYCANDVLILQKGLVRYMKACLEICGFNPLIHCCTVASFSFFILKNCHMKKDMLGILPDRQGYGSNDVQSELAIKYIQWLEETEGLEFQYSLRGGEYKIEGHSFKVDGYHKESNTVLEVLGCFYHGCPEHTRPETVNKINGKTMGQLHWETVQRLLQIEQEGYNMRIVWEHEITEQLVGNPTMAAFFNNVKHTKRLNLEDAFFGARTQNYVLKSPPLNPDTDRIVHLDVCSMYPYILSKYNMPMGTPEVITSDFLPLTLPLPYNGFYKVDILAPTSLRFPIIPMRHDSKLLFTLCRTCATNRKNEECHHELYSERLIHATVYQAELELALKHGYRVLKTYEIWHWPEEKWGNDLFKYFLRDFLKVKTETSGWPSENMTDEEKEKFIKDLYEHEGILIEKDKVIKNPALRQTAKLQCNTLWGKFCERPARVETIFYNIDSDAELPPLLFDERYEAVSADLIGDTMMVSLELKEMFREPKKYTNMAIACITTTHGRLILWEALHRLQERALYVDTDSVVMIELKDCDNLEDLQGVYLGKWTNETPQGWNIAGFVSTGPKVYSYRLVNTDTGELKEVVKARGVTIDSNAVGVVNYDGMSQLVDSLYTEQAAILRTSRPQFVKTFGSITTREQPKNLRAVMSKLRYLPDYTTLPYGYK